MGLKYHDGTKFRAVSPVTLIFPADAGAGLLNVTEVIIHEVGDLSAGILVRAFQNLQGLTSVTLPAGMTGGIGISAFASCTALTSVTLPAGMTGSIGNYAFASCSALTSLTLPAGMTGSIGNYAFASCTALTSLTLPAGMTGGIGISAFSGCTTLASLTLNSPTLMSLPNVNAFTNCPANIYVPAGLVSAYKAATNWSTLAARIFAI